MKLKVNEIFFSIQGESNYNGRPCIFVRLTGCNLRCSYCDTRYAYYDGKGMEIEEILETVARYGCNIVEVTGGEPLIQKNTPVLIKSLLDSGFEVLLETNGTMDISNIDERCIKIIDIKCPFSGEAQKNNMENLKILGKRDELKFVIANKEDFYFAKEVLNKWNIIPFRPNPVHFSPVFGILEPRLLAEWILQDKLEVRLNLQIHKIIWGGDIRGV